MSDKNNARPQGLQARDGQQVADMACSDSSTLAQLVAEVERWQDANPHLLAFIDGYAREHIQRGARFGVQSAIERLRWHRPVDAEGEDCAISNTWQPIIARLLVERLPEALPFIELRHSRFDAIFDARAGRGTS